MVCHEKETPKNLKKSSMEPISRPTAVQSVGEKSAESVEEKEDASTDITSAMEDAPDEVVKKEEAIPPETSNEVDSTAEAVMPMEIPENHLMRKLRSSEEENASESDVTKEQSDSEPPIIEEEQTQPAHVDEDNGPAPDASEETETVEDLDSIAEPTEKNSA